MAWIDVFDDHNVVTFGEGTPPGLVAATPSSLRLRDRALVSTLSHLARRYAVKDGHDIEGVPFETFLLRPAKTGFFAPWYEGQGEGYRVFIHRVPRKGELWGSVMLAEAYCEATIRRRTGKYVHLKPATRPFLDLMLDAYRQNADVQKIMRRTKHPFYYSQGL